MRHKRLLVFITCLIFITALITCFFSVFKLAEINVYTTSVENSNENVKELVDDYTKKYYEDNLLFVNENDICNDLKGLSGYICVKKVKKQYPNKLIVEVVERREVFALYINEKYYMIDENFVIIKDKDKNENNIDKNENILLNISVADFDNNSLKPNKNLNFYDKKTINYLKEISNLIYSYRENIKSVEIRVKDGGNFNRQLTITFKEGLKITLNLPDVKTTQKFNKAISFYLECEDKGDSNSYFVDYIESLDKVVIG